MIDKPTLHEVDYKTYMINCFGMQSPALIIGEERALLIDTAVGNYDLLNFIRSITDLPLIIAITHNHGDHIGGLGQFDTVYAPELDIPEVSEYVPEFLTRYISKMAPKGQCGCFNVPAELLQWKKKPKMIPMSDGYVFDLGGRKVVAYDCPGHTAGQMVFIDYTSRILYSGDAVNRNLGLAASSISKSLQGLLHVKSLEKLFDRNFTGHMGWMGNLETSVSEDPIVLNTCIEVCRGILDGKLTGVEIDDELFGHSNMIEMNGVRITYNPENL